MFKHRWLKLVLFALVITSMVLAGCAQEKATEEAAAAGCRGGCGTGCRRSCPRRKVGPDVHLHPGIRHLEPTCHQYVVLADHATNLELLGLGFR